MSTLGTEIKRLVAARARVAHLEDVIAARLRSELRALPKRYGFTNLKSFISAVTAACGSNEHRRSRAIITKATRVAVKNMARAGKTEAEIARAIGISPASVHKIKKSAGLVVARK